MIINKANLPTTLPSQFPKISHFRQKLTKTSHFLSFIPIFIEFGNVLAKLLKTMEF